MYFNHLLPENKTRLLIIVHQNSIAQNQRLLPSPKNIPFKKGLEGTHKVAKDPNTKKGISSLSTLFLKIALKVSYPFFFELYKKENKYPLKKVNNGIFASGIKNDPIFPILYEYTGSSNKSQCDDGQIKQCQISMDVIAKSRSQLTSLNLIFRCLFGEPFAPISSKELCFLATIFQALSSLECYPYTARSLRVYMTLIHL